MTYEERKVFIAMVRAKGARATVKYTTFGPSTKARQGRLTKIGFGPREAVRPIPGTEGEK